MVSAQFGLRHRGRSVRRVREILLGNEFGLDTFSIGVMLLTHSDRLKIFDDLSIDCAGDEFALNAGGMLFRAPFWVYRGAELRFGTRDVSVADACRGSVTGFIPPG